MIDKEIMLRKIEQCIDYYYTEEVFAKEMALLKDLKDIDKAYYLCMQEINHKRRAYYEVLKGYLIREIDELPSIMELNDWLNKREKEFLKLGKKLRKKKQPMHTNR